MKKVIIATDSCCDLFPEEYEKYDIKVVPLLISLGDKTGFDRIDILPKDIFDYVAQTGTLPKTAARSVGDFIDFFKSLTEDGSEVVYIGLSSGFSSNLQNAVIAAEEVGNSYVVDSRNLSSGIALCVLEACDRRDAGLPAAQIAEEITALTSKVNSSFILDRLDYIYKGGRCSAVAMLGANLLKLHPCIEVINGKMDVGKKYRGGMKDILLKYINDRLTAPGVKFNRKRIFVTDSCLGDEWSNACIEAVKQTGLFDEVIRGKASGTVSSHCGPGTLGILYITE